MFCTKKDPLIDLLKEYGYMPVALPRQGINPMDILEEQGKAYRKTTKISKIFKGTDDIRIPRKPEAKNAIDAIKGKRTGKVDSKLGISILEKWLKALGGNSANVKSSVEKAHRLIFEFNAPKVREVDWADLDMFLNNASINEMAKGYLDKILKNELYVIVSTLESNSFSIYAYDESDNNITGDIGLQDVAKFELKSNHSHKNRTRIEYKGEDLVVFGIQAAQLKLTKSASGETIFKIIETKDKVVRSSQSLREYTEELNLNLLDTNKNFLEIENEIE